MKTELLRDAYQILAGIPADRFIPYLEMFYEMNWDTGDRPKPSTVTCNTLACGLGWLALHPQFAPAFNKSCGFFFGIASETFGITLNQAGYLFGRRQTPSDLTDKALLLCRIRRVLGNDTETAFCLAQRDAS